jgi:primosomal protein N' (replication factor Y)
MQNVPGVSVQGPVPALVPRIRNQFIQEVWIKCQRDNKVLDKVKQMIITERRNITGERGNNGLQIQIDIDPQ